MDILKSCIDFTNALSSKEPTPGGGGASAFCGALGCALSLMVANLTKGKKKYAEYEGDICRIISVAEGLKEELLNLVEEDKRVFEPLSKAYGIPKDDPSRDEIMEKALLDASSVPVKIMSTVLKVIDLHGELAEKGSKLAVSDVGVGILFCKSALIGASLNVYINTKLMKNREQALQINEKTKEAVSAGSEKCDEIYKKVYDQIVTEEN